MLRCKGAFSLKKVGTRSISKLCNVFFFCVAMFLIAAMVSALPPSMSLPRRIFAVPEPTPCPRRCI